MGKTSRVVKARVAVMVGSRGRGTNMAALVTASRDGRLDADIVLVVSPRPDTEAVATAERLGVPVEVIQPSDDDYPARLVAVLSSYRVRYVCLAGLTSLLPQELLDAFPRRVLNIHPALLPKFGGKGMYGRHVHQAVIGSGERESGCSVHLVTENYDEGPVLLQLRCQVEPGMTPEQLAERVLKLEHEAYPMALQALIEEDARAT